MDGEGDGETDEFSAVPCVTDKLAGDEIVCACANVSALAVFLHRVTPRSNIALLGGAGGVVNASRAAERVASDGYAAAAVLGALVVCYAAVALAVPLARSALTARSTSRPPPCRSGRAPASAAGAGAPR